MKVQPFWIGKDHVLCMMCESSCRDSEIPVKVCHQQSIWRLCYIWHNLHDRAQTLAWTSHAIEEFKSLKQAFISSLSSSSYSQPWKHFIFTIDALDFALGNIAHYKWWEILSSLCRQLIIANHISMIISSGECTRAWKTFRQCAFHTYHRVKPAINIQISRNQGDAIFKHLSSRVLTILPLSTLKAFVQLSTERSIQADPLHVVVHSISHATRSRFTLSHTHWAWGQSHN